MTCEGIVEVLPAYALEALGAAEARAVREHVRVCPACRRELAAYQATAEGLVLAAPPAVPSRGLRSRVLGVALADAPDRAREPARASWVERLRTSLRELVWPSLTQLSPALAALALVLAVVATWQVISLQSTLAEQRAANRFLAEQVAARDRLVADLLGPGLATRELRGTDAAPDARATLFLNPDRPTALLSLTNLPSLPEDRAYQVWLIRDGRRTSGGLVVPDREGSGRLAIHAVEPLSAYQSVGITVEPRAGSPGPTGPRVLGGPI